MSNKDCIETSRRPPVPYKVLAKARSAAIPSPFELARHVWDTLLLWQERAEARAHLARLAPHYLKDVGLSEARAKAEARKPFWRA